MQKIRSVLKIGSSGVVLCDPYGSSAGASLELMLGTGSQLEFELRAEASGENALLPDYPAAELADLAYYFALDFNCGNNNNPPLLITSGIAVKSDENGRTVLTVSLVNNAVDGVLAELKTRSSMELICELGGIDGEGNTAFAWQFPATIRSRVYLGDGTPTLPPEVLYYTAAQINGIVAGLEAKIVPPAANKVMISDENEFFAGMDVEMALQSIGGTLEGLETELEGI